MKKFQHLKTLHCEHTVLYKTLTRSFRTYSAFKNSNKKKHLTSSRHASSQIDNQRADNQGKNVNQTCTSNLEIQGALTSLSFYRLVSQGDTKIVTACSLHAIHQSYYITSYLPSPESAHYSIITECQETFGIKPQSGSSEVVSTEGLYKILFNYRTTPTINQARRHCYYTPKSPSGPKWLFLYL